MGKSDVMQKAMVKLEKKLKKKRRLLTGKEAFKGVVKITKLKDQILKVVRNPKSIFVKQMMVLRLEKV